MVFAEIVGLFVALGVGVVFYSVSGIACPVQLSERPPAGVRAKSTGSGEFYFEFDKIFKLKMKSKSSAQLFQVGLLAVLVAVAFLIVTYGLKNLGY